MGLCVDFFIEYGINCNRKTALKTRKAEVGCKQTTGISEKRCGSQEVSRQTIKAAQF